jgi:DeoR/GlpR family transcriptional regulator of sugar metabolism
MLTQQRKQLILDRLRQDGRIVAADLSESLGLSEDTIRRDLRALAAAGLLQRVHGGALPSSPAAGNFETRSGLQRSGKQAIARAAAAMVQPGQVVFIDGGTSCQQLALHLPHGLHATVVTHSPTIALALVDHPHIEVLLVGGRFYKHSVVAVGAAAVEAIGRVHADLFFMGASGVSASVGLSTGDMEESLVKRAMMAHAAETWVLASAEKLNAASPYVIAACNEATGLIVEADTPEKATAAFSAQGLAVVRA